MNLKKKPGRNGPCPCGSGEKYKKCCLLSKEDHSRIVPPLSEAAVQKIHDREQLEQTRKEKFGEIRPCIHADFDGNKFVAVGNELLYSSNWKTFPDFLFDYIKHVLGSAWGNAEITKPFEQRHEIIKWYDTMCRFQQRQKKGPNGLYKSVPNGAMKAYLLLSYDLFTLRHHGALQNSLIERLKRMDQFQGSRHELFAAATCIRAGFEIAYEDEADRTRKHPEFTATHKRTSQKVSVEAKSRRRQGVLGQPGQKYSEQQVHLRIGNLLNNAFNKFTTYPYVIFFDLNFPPLSVRLFEKPWFDEINKTLDRITNKCNELNPYNLIVLSNQPYYYCEGNNPAPFGDILSIVAKKPRISVSHPEAIISIHEAANKFSKIPNTFEETG